MTLSDFIIYSVLVYFVLFITRMNNMWGVGKATSKARVDIRREKNLQKKRLRWTRLLSWCEWITYNVGNVPSENKLKDYQFRIDRLRWRVKVLDRELRATELIGILRLFGLLGSFIGVLGFVLSLNPLWFLFFGFWLIFGVFRVYSDFRISDEDRELERDFPDFYLVVYSRLVQGTKNRLAPVLQEYLRMLDVTHGGECKKPIKYFVLDFRNNIEIYGDDILAIMALREKYTSVMIINFCNLAIQALNGVNNADKLQDFKIELSHRRSKEMQKRADRLVAKGRRAVMVIYLILFQFILLSWYAKLQMAGGIRTILWF